LREELQDALKRVKLDSHTNSLVSDAKKLIESTAPVNNVSVLPTDDTSKERPSATHYTPAASDDATVSLTATDEGYPKLPKKPTHYKRVKKSERKEKVIGRPEENLE